MEVALDRSLKAHTLLNTVSSRNARHSRHMKQMEKKKKRKIESGTLVFKTEFYIQLLCHNLF